MAQCDYCGTTILFGGVNDNGHRFCNQECQQRGVLLTVSEQIPEELLSQHVNAAHQGECPRCSGPGPVDVHSSYTIWSALYLTSWGTQPQVCCRSCGTKSQLKGLLFSGLLGWWGFPFGLIMTPVQIGRNVVGMFSGPDPSEPSAELKKLVSINLAAHALKAVSQRQEVDR